MRKCRELSRLPPTGPLKSLNFRRTTPGSLVRLYAHYDPHAYRGALDPAHPGASLPRQALWRTMPSCAQPGFTLRAFPQAVLVRPLLARPDPPFAAAPRAWPGGRRANVSVLSVAAGVHKSAVIRRKLVQRVKAAWGLVVARGAGVEPAGGQRGGGGKAEGKQPRIVFWKEDVGAEKWLLDGWTYMLQPTLEVYRMPFEDLIPRLRTALGRLKERGSFLERQWAREAHSKKHDRFAAAKRGPEDARRDGEPVALPKRGGPQGVDLLDFVLSQHLENMEKTMPELEGRDLDAWEDDLMVAALASPEPEPPKKSTSAPSRNPVRKPRARPVEVRGPPSSKLFKAKPVMNPASRSGSQGGA